jgi:hypothetical protein
MTEHPGEVEVVDHRQHGQLGAGGDHLLGGERSTGSRGFSDDAAFFDVPPLFAESWRRLGETADLIASWAASSASVALRQVGELDPREQLPLGALSGPRRWTARRSSRR